MMSDALRAPLLSVEEIAATLLESCEGCQPCSADFQVCCSVSVFKLALAPARALSRGASAGARA